jgi:hypothetical protein
VANRLLFCPQGGVTIGDFHLAQTFDHRREGPRPSPPVEDRVFSRDEIDDSVRA